MTTELDDIMPTEVLNALTEHGIDITIWVKSGGTFDEAEREWDSQTETDTTVKGSPPYRIRQELLARRTLREDDLMVMIAAKDIGFTPDTGWRVEVKGSEYRIEAVIPYDTGTLTAAYELILRA